MFPPTRTGVGFGAPGVAWVAGSLGADGNGFLELADLQRDRAVPVRILQLELLAECVEPWQLGLEHCLPPAVAGNWNLPAASVVAFAVAPSAPVSVTSTPGRTPPLPS